MSDQETAEGQAVFLREIKKRIVPYDEDNPAVEPTFINYGHGVVVGGSYYLDVGVITLESFSQDNQSRIGDFAVIHRLVMSRETMTIIQQQIANVLEHGDGSSASSSSVNTQVKTST
jgi:hypothetical protein